MKKNMIWTDDITEITYDYEDMRDPYDQIHEAYEAMKDDIVAHEKAHGSKYYIILATIECWNGSYTGGKIIKGMCNVINACLEDFNAIYTIDKRLFIKAAHHDGMNHFQIRELVPRGEEYLSRRVFDMSDRDLHYKLFKNSRYSREVKLFADLYG